MAYTKTWDESHPPGSLPADQIDTAIQDTKTALRERLEQVVPGFGNDAVDPKRIKAATQGTLAERPTVTWGGLLYVATDEGKVYYTAEGGAWQDWPGGSGDGGSSILKGLDSAKPNPATADFYYATDIKRLYIKNTAEPPIYEASTMEMTGAGAVNVVTQQFGVSIPAGATAHEELHILVSAGPFNTRVPIGVRARIKRTSGEPFPTWASWWGRNTIQGAEVGGESLGLRVTGLAELGGGGDPSSWQVWVEYMNTDAGDSATAIVEIRIYLMVL